MYLISGNITSNVTGNLPVITGNGNIGNITSNFRTLILLITNRKSHTGFRLVPTSMTLNDLERRNSPYFAFFTELDRFSGRLHHSG